MYDLKLIENSSLGISLEYFSMDFFWEFAGFLRPPVKDRDRFLTLFRDFLTDGGARQRTRRYGSQDDLTALSAFRYQLEEISEDAEAIWRWIVLFSDSNVPGLNEGVEAWRWMFFERTRVQNHVGAYLPPERFGPLQKAYRRNVSIPEKLIDPKIRPRDHSWFELDQRSEWDELVYRDNFGEIGVSPGDGLIVGFDTMLRRRFLLLHLGDLNPDEHQLLLEEARLTDKLKKNRLYQDRLMALPDLVALYPQEMKDAILVDKWTFGRKP